MSTCNQPVGLATTGISTGYVQNLPDPLATTCSLLKPAGAPARALQSFRYFLDSEMEYATDKIFKP